jgi:hypothetical protein
MSTLERNKAMNIFDRTITVRIIVDQSEKLTNGKLDSAFKAVIKAIEIAVDEDTTFMDAAQQSMGDEADVQNVVILRWHTER